MNEGGIKGKGKQGWSKDGKLEENKNQEWKTTVKKGKGIVGSRKFVGSLQFVGKKSGRKNEDKGREKGMRKEKLMNDANKT